MQDLMTDDKANKVKANKTTKDILLWLAMSLALCSNIVFQTVGITALSKIPVR